MWFLYFKMFDFLLLDYYKFFLQKGYFNYNNSGFVFLVYCRSG